ncbi:MAG: hypothetical protein AABX95_02155, partial [Nanoarchaeota archaeon]
NLYNKHIYQINMSNMQKLLETKERIIEVIKKNGPELPVRVANAIGNNNIFTAAFMSELVGEQKLKISNMRVGSSPLYYISGQEEQLQKYSNYLNNKEKEAFNLLKQNNVLEDSQLEPAIRVALRHIKDFATPIQIIDKGETKIFWKLHTLTNEKAKELIEKVINPPIKKQEKAVITEQKIEEMSKKQEVKEIIQSHIVKEENPIIQIKKAPKLKEINSPFLDNINKLLIEKEYEITKEISIKKKEFTGKIKMQTILGIQEFYLVAKDKKKITLEDLVSTLQKANAEKMPALIISPGDIEKKAQEYFKEWNNLIKHQKVNF